MVTIISVTIEKSNMMYVNNKLYWHIFGKRFNYLHIQWQKNFYFNDHKFCNHEKWTGNQLAYCVRLCLRVYVFL